MRKGRRVERRRGRGKGRGRGRGMLGVEGEKGRGKGRDELEKGGICSMKLLQLTVFIQYCTSD